MEAYIGREHNTLLQWDGEAEVLEEVVSDDSANWLPATSSERGASSSAARQIRFLLFLRHARNGRNEHFSFSFLN